MKKRMHVILSEEAKKKLAELAKKEGRSNSSMVEQLILKARG